MLYLRVWSNILSGKKIMYCRVTRFCNRCRRR